MVMSCWMNSSYSSSLQLFGSAAAYTSAKISSRDGGEGGDGVVGGVGGVAVTAASSCFAASMRLASSLHCSFSACVARSVWGSYRAGGGACRAGAAGLVDWRESGPGISLPLLCFGAGGGGGGIKACSAALIASAIFTACSGGIVDMLITRGFPGVVTGLGDGMSCVAGGAGRLHIPDRPVVVMV